MKIQTIIVVAALTAFATATHADTHLPDIAGTLEAHCNSCCLVATQGSRATSAERKAACEAACSDLAISVIQGLGKRVGDEKSACTYVYLACGTCPDGSGRAKVEHYCDDGGSGPEPDGYHCETC